MEKLTVVKCFIEDRAFEASNGRLYYVKPEDRKIQIYSRMLEDKIALTTDANNEEESAHWLLKDNKIFFKSKEGLVEIPNQFSNSDRDYEPKPLIKCDLAFCCAWPRFVRSSSYGNYAHDYFVLKANGDGTYDDISEQFKESKYWYIRSIGTYGTTVRITTKKHAIDDIENYFEVSVIPTEICRLEYVEEKITNASDRFSKEEHDKLQNFFKNLV